MLELGVFDLGARRKPQVFYRGCGESMEIQSELACNQIISRKQRLPMKRTQQAHAHRGWPTRRPRRLRLRSYRQSVSNPSFRLSQGPGRAPTGVLYGWPTNRPEPRGKVERSTSLRTISCVFGIKGGGDDTDPDHLSSTRVFPSATTRSIARDKRGGT